MNKKFNNGAIFTIAQVMFGVDSDRSGLAGKTSLKSCMAVRQALKFNYSVIANAYNNIQEMITEVQKELILEYLENGKATKDEEERVQINPEYCSEFDKEIEAKLNDLTSQTVELNVYTIPENEYLKWANLNDGMLTDEELDIVEIFVEFEKKEEETKDDVEHVKGEVINE